MINVGFTGDIGRPNRPILRDPQIMDKVDYLICESTYGDKEHEGAPKEIEKLLEIIHHTCVEKKGKLIIPAFSVGRHAGNCLHHGSIGKCRSPTSYSSLCG